MIGEMLGIQRDDCFGYQKHECSETADSRNGYSPKNVHLTQGKLDIPRDQEGQFKS